MENGVAEDVAGAEDELEVAALERPRGAGTTTTTGSGAAPGGAGGEERRADNSGILKNPKCQGERMCRGDGGEGVPRS